MSLPLRVGIMGAGRMAQAFDAPGDPHVLSLAHAVRRTDALVLGGFFDADADQAAGAEARWSAPPSPRGRTAWLDAGWDIVCIATPDDSHGDDLADVLAGAPRAVVVEKPLATDPALALALLDQAASACVPVIVDFPRRFHSAIETVRVMTSNDRALGAPRAAQLAFTGAPERAAVHMFDLIHDIWGGDWSVSVHGEIAGSTLLLLRDGTRSWSVSVCRPEGDPYYLWEMSVFCARGKVVLTRSPEVLEVFVPAPHPLYGDFQVLTERHRFDMEAEPLLCRLMETVVSVATDKHAAERQSAREASSQRFSGAMLSALAEGAMAA